MHQSKWIVLVALLVAAEVLTLGCPGCAKNGNEEDAGVDAGPTEVDAGEDAGVDAGPDLTCTVDSDCMQKVGVGYICDDAQSSTNTTFGTCVKACRIDDDCEHYDMGLRCDDKSGHCIAAKGCNDDTNCPPQQFDPTDYCNVSGLGCRCVTETNGTGFPGVCRRRHAPCEECTYDEQCGVGSTFEPNGRCKSIQGDPNGALEDGGTRKYCMYAPSGQQCGCGLVLNANDALCYPQSGTCSQVGCGADKDCPFGSVCNVAACLCEPRCIWNFDRQELNPPGCGPGKTCWVDPGNLDAGSPFFGAGRCRPPCDNESQCQAEDPRLTCKGEQVAGGVSDKRCRPDGECMDNFECPQQPPESVYLGYCDRGSFTCKTDCRTGIDPTTNQPYTDCVNGYKCVDQNGTNICKQQTCLELGGARLGCGIGQFCCGEDRNGDGTPEQCPLTGVEPNNCYPAPQPPFCTTCTGDSDCNQPGYNINSSPFPSICIGAGDRPDGGDPVGICAVATFNDFSLDQNGVTAAYRGCPSKYAAVPHKVECASNAACDAPGAPGTGVCDADLTQTFPDGGHPLVCLCTGTGTPDDGSHCPPVNGGPDAGGSQSYCKYAPIGAQSQCLSTIVCTPSPGMAYKDPSEGGCGL